MTCINTPLDVICINTPLDVICLCAALSVSVVGLERALLQYCSQPNEQPFDIKTVPIETAPSLVEGPRCKLLNYIIQCSNLFSKGHVLLV